MYLPDFKRNKFGLLSKRLQEKLPFIQVLLGPRQVGKTTAVHQILDNWPIISSFWTAPIWSQDCKNGMGQAFPGIG
jgi:hypothetical protein